MDLSQVHSGVQKRKRRKRVGRGVGSGHGKTATRGHKGQWSITGGGFPSVVFEGGQLPLFRRVPKRGFTRGSFSKKFHIVNVGDIDAAFDGSTKITPEELAKVGLAKGPADGVRILGNGEVTKKLDIQAHYFTKSALEKIAAKGGQTEVIPPPKKPVKNKMKPRSPKE